MTLLLSLLTITASLALWHKLMQLFTLYYSIKCQHCKYLNLTWCQPLAAPVQWGWGYKGGSSTRSPSDKKQCDHRMSSRLCCCFFSFKFSCTLPQRDSEYSIKNIWLYIDKHWYLRTLVQTYKPGHRMSVCMRPKCPFTRSRMNVGLMMLNRWGHLLVGKTNCGVNL